MAKLISYLAICIGLLGLCVILTSASAADKKHDDDPEWTEEEEDCHDDWRRAVCKEKCSRPIPLEDKGCFKGFMEGSKVHISLECAYCRGLKNHFCNLGKCRRSSCMSKTTPKPNVTFRPGGHDIDDDDDQFETRSTCSSQSEK